MVGAKDKRGGRGAARIIMRVRRLVVLNDACRGSVVVVVRKSCCVIVVVEEEEGRVGSVVVVLLVVVDGLRLS